MATGGGISRRQAVIGGAAASTALALGAAGAAGGGARSLGEPEPRSTQSAAGRMPAIFIPHGGGPWPVLRLPQFPQGEADSLASYMRSIARTPSPPSALLVVSAHWEESAFTINTNPRPGMYYDYGGFPDAAYKLSWPAPGAPELARRVAGLLQAAGFETRENSVRGYDHGVFVPLMLAYPAADVPVVQLSLLRGLSPAAHLALGRALAPLRDAGVYLIGSGNSYHNLRAFFSRDPRAAEAARDFDAWLEHTVQLPSHERDVRLEAWDSAPGARASHPREEHLLPLMVMAGAAGTDPGRVAWRGGMNGVVISAIHFG